MTATKRSTRERARALVQRLMNQDAERAATVRELAALLEAGAVEPRRTRRRVLAPTAIVEPVSNDAHDVPTELEAARARAVLRELRRAS